MGLTLQAIRDYVRGYPDIDSDDLSDAVLDVFVREGFNTIASSERTWDFYQVDYTLVTQESVQGYAFDAIGDNALADISMIVGTKWTLKPAPHQLAQDRFPSSTTSTREPKAWSAWADTLYLWPTPDAAYTLHVMGYREPSDWVSEGAGGAPDLPDDMHELVALWALSRTYAQQDDLDQADRFRIQFDQQFAAIRPKHLGSGPAVPLVMNGGKNQLEAYGLFPPLFSWE